MDIEQMTPRRPFLLRAFYDWLLDNELTPHLVVDATLPGVKVPMEFVQDGQIILNIAPRAVGNLELADDSVRFNARFSGKPHNVFVPMYALQAIYARENGAGTLFEPEEQYMNLIAQFSDDGLGNVDEDRNKPEPPPKGRPQLRVIK